MGNKQLNNIELQRLKDLVAQRRVEHEEDLRAMDLRRMWKRGDDMDCWEQTVEEKKFGIKFSPPPTHYNRFDILDIE